MSEPEQSRCNSKPHAQRERRFTQLAAYTAAGLFITASAAIGVLFGFTYGAKYNFALGVILALGALAGELFKPIAVAAAFEGVRRLRFSLFAAAAPLAAVCIVYSLVAEFSLSSNLRGDVTAQRAHAIEVAQIARAQRDRALGELRALPSAVDTPGALEGEIVRLLATPGAVCDAAPGTPDYGPVTRDVCPRVAAVRARLAIVQRRIELQRSVEKAEADLKARGTGAEQVDPTATNLVGIAAMFGIKWTASGVASWIVLLVPLFLEIGSSLGLVVAATFGGVQSNRASEGGGVQSPVGGEQSDTHEREGGRVFREAEHRSAIAGGGEMGRAKDRLVQILHDRGGRVQSGQRALAELTGTSTTRLNQILKDLSQNGKIRVRADRLRGTEIRLNS